MHNLACSCQRSSSPACQRTSSQPCCPRQLLGSFSNVPAAGTALLLCYGYAAVIGIAAHPCLPLGLGEVRPIKAMFRTAPLAAAAGVSQFCYQDKGTPSLRAELERPFCLPRALPGLRCCGSRESAHRPSRKEERSAMLGSAARLREVVS